jgi:hypothetical protein
MVNETLKARLNLNAVMRNLEELPGLDPETAKMISSWDIAIRFLVPGGISARLGFKEGRCTYQTESTEPADVVLCFATHGHLNAMFENRGLPPLPLKGFKRLGFLKDDFSKLTKRLEYFLKPTPALLEDAAYVRVNTVLSLYTATQAVCELIRLDPVSQQVGAQMPAGVLQLSVLPDGPHAYIQYDGKGGAAARTGVAEKPSAVLTIDGCANANGLFNGKMDGFAAIALGTIRMKGIVPIIENTNLILDRIPLYLQ